MATGMRQHYAIMVLCALVKDRDRIDPHALTSTAVELADLLDKKLRRLDQAEEPPMPRRQIPMEDRAA